MKEELCAFILLLATTTARQVSISNSKPRLTTSGKVVDAHSGNIVGPVNGTYFLYGEWYGDGNFDVTHAVDLPKLAVYTSTTLTSGSWQFRGLLHNNTSPGWVDSPLWPWAPRGAWYVPSAVYSEARQKFVIYWTASQAECCEAQWGVAQSDDGVHFQLLSLNQTASMNSSLDGSFLFLDDDGSGYVAYTAMQAPGLRGHVVAIDRLSPDLLSSSGERVFLFPDFFVEGAVLFKRRGLYYVIYGSCCCACRQGSGAVVSTAPTIRGPWTRQTRDANCNADAPVCAGMPDGQIAHERPLGHLTISAQGTAVSVLPSGGTDDATVLWHGQRWLSGPHNPPACTTLCDPPTGVCQQAPNYVKGADFDYWIPLAFDSAGKVMQFTPFVDEFRISLL